jgi:hypothetical protein
MRPELIIRSRIIERTFCTPPKNAGCRAGRAVVFASAQCLVRISMLETGNEHVLRVGDAACLTSHGLRDPVVFWVVGSAGG